MPGSPRIIEHMFPSEITEVREAMTGLTGRFQAGVLSVEAAEAVVADAAAIKNMAATIEALAAARVAATGRWKSTGDASPEEWLARRTGTTKSQAQAALRTGASLERLPEVADAARAGALSPTQAAEIADAAVADPNAGHRLVDLAAKGASVGELRDECRRTRAAPHPDPDATHRRIHRNRSLREFTDSDGAWNLHLRDTTEVGAEVRAALQPLIDERFARARRAGEREPHDAYAADAFTELSRRAATGSQRATSAPAEGETGDEKATAGGDATAPARRPTPYLALLRLDVEALQRGRADGDEVVEIAGLGPIPVQRAKDLLGNAILKLVITKGVDVANVTHLGRGPNAAQKAALLWRSPTCTVQGCNRARRLQTDHRTPWAAQQVTELHNLDPLCRHHHAKKTHDGWALVVGTGKRPMVPPDHPEHPDVTGADQGTGPPSHAPRLDPDRPAEAAERGTRTPPAPIAPTAAATGGVQPPFLGLEETDAA
jgi:hypothetical protein